jgi:hypothetical protein
MITLAQMAKNANQKLVQGFINELVTDSFLLNALTFDDCLDSNGESKLVYAYDRVITPASAQLREINSENATFSTPEIEQYTTSPAVINSQFKIDRVTGTAAPSLLALHLEEAKNAIIRTFGNLVINGDKADDPLAFDGLSKALTGSDTEVASEVDLTTAANIKANAFDFAAELDDLLTRLSGDPGVLLVGRKGKNRLAQVGRALGIYQLAEAEAGRRIAYWDGVPVQQLADGIIANDDIYAVRFGPKEFHGITLTGGRAIAINPPDFDSAGAIKPGDAELVAGVVLKATKAAGVLRAYASEG